MEKNSSIIIFFIFLGIYFLRAIINSKKIKQKKSTPSFDHDKFFQVKSKNPSNVSVPVENESIEVNKTQSDITSVEHHLHPSVSNSIKTSTHDSLVSKNNFSESEDGGNMPFDSNEGESLGHEGDDYDEFETIYSTEISDNDSVPFTLTPQSIIQGVVMSEVLRRRYD